MKNVVKLLFLVLCTSQYSFGIEWYDFFEENGSLVYQLRYYSKLFKKDQKDEDVNYNRETHVDKADGEIKEYPENINEIKTKREWSAKQIVGYGAVGVIYLWMFGIGLTNLFVLFS